MLTCCSLYTRTAACKSVLFGTTYNNVSLLKILFNISVCSFISNGSNGTRFENVTVTEKRLCISVSSRLILTGKVKVNIRALVTLEAKEGFERNIVSVTDKVCSAFGTSLNRKVIA